MAKSIGGHMVHPCIEYLRGSIIGGFTVASGSTMPCKCSELTIIRWCERWVLRREVCVKVRNIRVIGDLWLERWLNLGHTCEVKSAGGCGHSRISCAYLLSHEVIKVDTGEESVRLHIFIVIRSPTKSNGEVSRQNYNTTTYTSETVSNQHMTTFITCKP